MRVARPRQAVREYVGSDHRPPMVAGPAAVPGPHEVVEQIVGPCHHKIGFARKNRKIQRVAPLRPEQPARAGGGPGGDQERPAQPPARGRRSSARNSRLFMGGALRRGCPRESAASSENIAGTPLSKAWWSHHRWASRAPRPVSACGSVLYPGILPRRSGGGVKSGSAGQSSVTSGRFDTARL